MSVDYCDHIMFSTLPPQACLALVFCFYFPSLVFKLSGRVRGFHGNAESQPPTPANEASLHKRGSP